MSTESNAVKLITFAAYKKNAETSEIEVSSGNTAKRNPAGVVEIMALNVPLRDGVVAPSNGLLMLYGKDSVIELQKRRAEAAEAGWTFKFAEVTVDVGEIFAGVHDENSIKKATFFCNFRRMSASLQQLILDEFCAYEAEDEGYIDATGDRTIQVGARIDLFSKLFEQNKLFKMSKIKVMIIPCYENGKVRSLAYVREGATILKLDQAANAGEPMIVLPKFFKRPNH